MASTKQSMALIFYVLLPVNSAAPSHQDAEQVYVLTQPEHTMEQVEKAYAALPPLRYVPPSTRWQFLPKTAAALAREGGSLRVVMLGDSIVNDTSRSRWDDVLQMQYPKAKIVKTTCVRGSTGCWWFKTPERVKRYVLDFKPDLLIIGGISHRNDIDSVKELITRVRERSNCDVLLMTPVFGQMDPRDDKQWQEVAHPAASDYRARLVALAGGLKTGLVDMTEAWGSYVRGSGKDLNWFKRDAAHANERGEQVIGRILATHLSPPLPAK
jgi:hypothetical protein